MQTVGSIVWTFRKNKELEYGSRLLVSGNVPQLGDWKIQLAVPMHWTEGNNWELTVKLPKSIIQYKLVTEDSKGNRVWQNTPNKNCNIQDDKLFRKQLVLMSYNIRMDTKADKEFAWKYRKEPAVEKLLQNLPSVIGVQQALKHQKIDLCEKLNDYYDYFGVARDLKQDEECGIFYLTHRFKIAKHGFIWFNQTKTPAKIGFGARLPRKLTYLIMQDMYLNTKFIVINTHLDHESLKSQTQSVKIILQTLKQLQGKYQINDLFVMGDFNVQQNSVPLRYLLQSDLQFKSCRNIVQDSDKFPTFHFFNGERQMQQIQKGNKVKAYTIDHIYYSGKKFNCDSFKVLVTPKPYMSDHYPVYASFSLNQINDE